MPMTFWTIPFPIIAVIMLVGLYLSLVGMKIQQAAYSLADGMAADKTSGISNRNLESFVKRIVPGWSRAAAWLGGLSSVCLLVYVGFRFGWPWALGYIVADHLLKNLKIPIFPGQARIQSVLLGQAEQKAPDKVPGIKRFYAAGKPE